MGILGGRRFSLDRVASQEIADSLNFIDDISRFERAQ